jgi:oxygen-independent coproporphyrinogen-3 oxidase
VYVHVPFCARKCPYCDFASYAGRDDEQDAVVTAILAEARTRLDGSGARTLYVGGGTPTHLDAARLHRLLDGVRTAMGRPPPEEFTVEANPGTLDATKLDALVRAGVTRVSLGAQSFDDDVLARLGRIHRAEDTRRAVRAVRAAAIDDLSLDLILAAPGQDLRAQEADLEAAISLAPDHVSAYVLTVEAGTPLARAVERGEVAAPDADREAAHLALAVRVLEASGFRRYEVSNYARPGRPCRHNLAYWRGADWIGLGPGAHTHVRPRRSKNVDDPAEYVARIGRGGLAAEWVETAPPEVVLFEALLMGLRLVDGVDLQELTERTGRDPRRLFGVAIARHAEAGLLVREGDRLRATARGLDLLSRVLVDFVPEQRPVLRRLAGGAPDP